MLAFLSDWGPTDLLLACSDALIECNPRSIVSSLDLRARALLELGRPEEALAAVRERLARKDSFTGRLLHVRVHLARGDAKAAREVAEGMTRESPATTLGWQALAEVELARGHPQAAVTALRYIAEIVPDHRASLLGTARAYAAMADWVRATGYAVSALEGATPERPLPVSDLRLLLDLCCAAGETTRAQDVEEELAARYAAALESVGAALAEHLGAGRGAPAAAPAPEQAHEQTLAAAAGAVAVSPDEHARIAAAARDLFGFDTLLPGQAETIACAIRGESALTVLPTGGGKSLCYQLPALLDESGVTLVISPLIALMQDQLDHVPQAGRDLVTFVNSTLDAEAMKSRLAGIARGRYRLVYVAPERLRQPPFLHYLRCAGARRVVIDEAHCVSAWGHDFRPDYLAIGDAVRELGDPPLLAFTATAPERVRRDILRHLGNLQLVAVDPNRANLRFEVFQARDADEKLELVLSFCRAEAGSGIVYAGTRERSEQLAALLRRFDVQAEHYHAGVEDRRAAQERFMRGETRVVVATNAFGLGIDKPDIRFVLHFLPPDSVEAYYQEAGRAGRDGQPARCALLYSSADRGLLTRHANESVLPLPLLRQAHEAVARRLRGESEGRVAEADLERDLQTDPVRARVALGLLEQSGLLQRGPDVPRSVTLRPTDGGDDGDAEFAAFCGAVHLRPGQWLTLDPADAARQAGIPLAGCERRLLDWWQQGLLSYRASARDFCLGLHPWTPEREEALARLLEGYATMARQRASDMAAYALTRRCRHGYLNQYLGGGAISRCQACDNCHPLPRATGALPDERAQALEVLSASAGHGWGRQNLVSLLRGDARASAAALGSPHFGALAYRSDAGVEALIARLEAAGLLRPRQLPSGGAVLELTRQGADALRQPELLDDVVVPPRPPGVPPSVPGGPEAEALFQTLRQWRLEAARTESMPPYVILHDSVLREIAATRPRTLEALSRIKGIGPAKLAKYGEAVLAVVSGGSAAQYQ